MSPADSPGLGGCGPDAAFAAGGCARPSVDADADSVPGFGVPHPHHLIPVRGRERAGALLMLCGVIAAAAEALAMVVVLAAAILERVSW